MSHSDLRTPLCKARGLGSSKHGTAHWWAQRVTAMALFPLMFFLIFSGLVSGLGTYETAVAWLSFPSVALAMILFLMAAFYHASLGLQVVIEDYISREGVKIIGIVLMRFVCSVLAAAGIFSVLKIALS